MLYDPMRTAQRAAVVAVVEAAKNLNIPHGGAVALILDPQTPFWEPTVLAVNGKFYRDHDSTRENDANGTNYGGVVLAKLFESIRTGLPSGDVASIEGLKTGELGWKGCVLDVDKGILKLYVGFSGGSPEQDVMVSTVGLAILTRMAEIFN